MDSNQSTMCKVIVHDCNPEHTQCIREFCERNNLIPVKSQTDTLMEVLKSNVDLGAVFISEDIEGQANAGLELCKRIHKIRPELPIILKQGRDSLSEELKNCDVFSVSYKIEDIDSIRAVLDETIFNKFYPNALLRGMNEIAIETLGHSFESVDIRSSSPYLVKDRIIYGELFSLIPMESSWCRGYMMLQTDQKNIVDLVKSGIVSRSEYDFRLVNDILSEVTNMMWGGIKSRFIPVDEQGFRYATHVPIIVNHQNKYITFGTDIPQLCFKYHLTQKGNAQKEVVLYQKFVFNLSWEPDKFTENQPSIDDFLDSGELELF